MGAPAVRRRPGLGPRPGMMGTAGADWSPMSTAPCVRKATYADVDRLAGALARAFDDDPVMTHLWPDAARRRAVLPAFFGAELHKVHLPLDEVWITHDLASGALWDPPGRWRLGIGGQIRLLPTMIRLFGAGLARASATLAVAESKHPKVPEHYYLAVLGTDTERQGQGLGSAALAPVLEKCDLQGVPAYLESSKETNVPFYRRHGFEVSEEFRLGRNGPPIWGMWREPAG